MIRSSVIAASLLFSNASPASVILSDSVEVSPRAIVQVVCLSKDEITAGTAFRVGTGLLLSVNHVTSASNCFIDGKPISVWYASPKADFSMLHGGEGPFIKIDCGGFVKGRKYIAIGFARAETPVTSIEMVATGETDHGMAVLEGMVPVIPGMSGGPILSEDTGEVVGTVNAENFEDGLSWSVELKNTPVCRKDIA